MHLSLQRHTLRAFRGVQAAVTLDFSALPPGLYFVQGLNKTGTARLGSNGAGKSTFFSESFLWLLSGQLSQLKVPGAHVENRSSDGKASVKTELLLDGVVSTVERTRGPNGLFLDDGKISQSELDNLIPLSEAALRRSIFLDQFADMFLKLKSEEKSRIFSETLSLDKWVDAADRAGERLSKIEGTIGIADRAMAEAKGRLEVAEEQLAEAIKAEDGWADDKKLRRREMQARAAEAKRDNDECFAALNDARKALARFSGLDNAVVELNDLKAILREKRPIYARAVADLEFVRNEVARLRRQQESYSDTKTCPECGYEVPQEHIADKLKKLKRELLTEKNKSAVLVEQVDEGEEFLRGIENRMDDIDAMLPDWNKAQTVVSVAAERSIAATGRMHRVNAAVDEVKAEVNPYTKQCDVLEQRIKDIKADQAEVERQLEAAQLRQEMCKFWQKGFREIRLKQIDDTLLELEIAANRHAETLGLDDYRVEFDTERETKKGTISHGFTVMLYPPDGGDAVPFEVYSGGEGQRWQLAVTFGLSDVLLERAGISTDFEIIDEPTAHLSPEGIDDLLVCLKERSQRMQRRIFLIDQHVLGKGAFDRVITVIRDEDGSYVEDDGCGLVVKRKRERMKL